MNEVVVRISATQRVEVATLISRLWPKSEWASENLDLFLKAVERYPYEWVINAIEQHRLEESFRSPSSKHVLRALRNRHHTESLENKKTGSGSVRPADDPNDETYGAGWMDAYRACMAIIERTWESPDWGAVHERWAKVRVRLMADPTRERDQTANEVLAFVEDRRLGWKLAREMGHATAPRSLLVDAMMAPVRKAEAAQARRQEAQPCR